MTVGTVGKVAEPKKDAPAHPAQPEKKPEHPAQPAEKPKTPKEEFQALVNDWAHMLPVAFINRLEDFASKHIK